MVWKLYHGTFVSLTDVKMVKTWTDQIKSNLFAQNTSHFNAASGKSSWWAGPTRLKRALTVTLKRQVKQILSTNNVFRLMDLSKFREIRASRWLLWHSDYIKFEFGRWGSLWRSPRHPSRLGKGMPLPILHPIDAFGVESRVRPPEIQNILRRRCWRTQQLDLV